MLVILRENVQNLGRIGDVVKVSDGYARNYLLPQNLVVAAEEHNVAAIEHHKKALEKRRLAQKGVAEELSKKISETQVTLSRKVGENDKLFGSVSAHDIAEQLKKAGYAVDKRMVEIDQPIKALGVHTVSVKLEPEVVASLKVWVVKEES
jgi:large subunit ribosomal protein L9